MFDFCYDSFNSPVQEPPDKAGEAIKSSAVFRILRNFLNIFNKVGNRKCAKDYFLGKRLHYLAALG